MEISVIIPTYKPNKHLFECLNIIRDQTLSEEKYEVIIILNGVKNPYMKKIRDYLKQINYDNFRLEYSLVKGVSNARNIGLDVAKGDNIVFIDDDDIISQNYLEELNSMVSTNNIVVSNVRTFRNDINSCGNDYITNCFIKNTSKQTGSILLKRCFMSSVCAKIIPSHIINSRRFNKAFAIGEDGLFMSLISDKIIDINLTSNKVIYYRRLSNNSASRKKKDVRELMSISFMILSEYIKTYVKSPFKYNSLFFLTRIAATIKLLLIKLLH